MDPILNVNVLGITISIWDYADYYWAKVQGVTIARGMINGWWHIKG